MKKIILAFVCISTTILPVVLAQKASRKAVYTPDFPPAMTVEVRKAYTGLFEKGKILYGINCSRCHDTTIRGIQVMPEFTKEHLAQYELRIQNPQHEESLSEMRVNAEELQQVMIFLMYCKRIDKDGKGRK